MNPSTLSITSMITPAEAEAFQTLNEEWISRIFTMEESDRKTLDDPFGAVVDRGGDVLIVRDGEEIVGCVSAERIQLPPYARADVFMELVL